MDHSQRNKAADTALRKLLAEGYKARRKEDAAINKEWEFATLESFSSPREKEDEVDSKKDKSTS